MSTWAMTGSLNRRVRLAEAMAEQIDCEVFMTNAKLRTPGDKLETEILSNKKIHKWKRQAGMRGVSGEEGHL